MRVQPPAIKRCILSIGHSNHSFESFLELLKRHQIEALVDVRSQPFSKYASHFDLDPLRQAVTAAGVKYVFLGKELGGRPTGDGFYDADGHVLYGRMAEAPFFLKGIEHLERWAEQYRTALMCSEENPAVCHRYLLVARVLGQRGIEVEHIRGDGRIEREAEVAGAANAEGSERQLTLFGEAQKAPWRSLRPILPKSSQASSAER